MEKILKIDSLRSAETLSFITLQYNTSEIILSTSNLVSVHQILLVLCLDNTIVLSISLKSTFSDPTNE